MLGYNSHDVVGIVEAICRRILMLGYKFASQSLIAAGVGKCCIGSALYLDFRRGQIIMILLLKDQQVFYVLQMA